MVTLLIIFSIVWMPFDNIFMANIATGNIAYAQTTGGFTSSGANLFTSTSGKPGISGYIKGLAPAIAQSPQCKAVIKSGMKSLFKGIKSIVGKKKGTGEADKTLSQTIDEGQAEADAVHNYDKNLNQTAEEALRLQKEQAEADAKQAENDLCLKSIGRRVALMLLQKITLSLVTWIQSGYEGKPFFVQDPKGFFTDIYKNEILQFGGEITDPTLYPFGTAFMQNTINAVNTKFQENARYSLNELIKQTTPEYSGTTFSLDFAAGGWNAWDALTAVPANNPLGFQLMASSELAKRLEGTQKSTATLAKEGLDRAGGFLGQDVCVDPDNQNITHASSDAALEAGEKEYDGVSFVDLDGDGIPADVDTNDNDHDNDGVADATDDDDDNDGIPDGLDQIDWQSVSNPGNPTGRIVGACYKWKYETAAEQIMHKANAVLDYPENGILEAEDLNDAIFLLLDSVLAQFTSKIQEGFAKATNEGADGSFIVNTYNADGNYVVTQVEKDFTPGQMTTWLEQNPDFNIRTDITQAMIDEQRIYIQKLEDQNLMIKKLVMAIRQLDYCIPGQNPLWEQTSNIDTLYENIKDSPNGDVGLNFFDTVATTLISAFDPTGLFSGIASAMFEKKHERDVKIRIAVYITKLLGVFVDPKQDQIINESGIRSLLENTYESYRQVIYNTYFAGANAAAFIDGAMPQVTPQARKEFEDIPSYEQMADANFEDLTFKKSVVARLVEIKDAIDGINATIPDQDSQQYSDAIKAYIPLFARLTGDMVTGDDIETEDNTLQDLTAREKYVFEDLLQGPGGCEEDMQKLYDSEADHHTYKKYARREPYPLPIYYFYPPVYDTPSNIIPWSKDLVDVWDPKEIFLYGAVYWNFWARPYDDNPHPGTDPVYGEDNSPNLAKIADKVGQIQGGACKDQFINIVELSLPGPDSTSPAIKDLGGLLPEPGSVLIDNPDEPYLYQPDDNVCGILGKFEKMLGVY